MSDQHQLPEWFLNHNITLKKDLDGIRPKIEVVDSKEAKATKPTDEARDDQAEKQPRDLTKCQVSSDTFSMLRDVLASAFARNSDGHLDPKQSFVILDGGGNPAAPIDFLDELVKALAKEIGTSLISYDYEDLEDLALEFSQQSPAGPSQSKPDKKMDKKMDWDPSMAKHWFASSSEFDTDAKKEVWEKTQRSYSTILDAVPNNEVKDVPEDEDATETTRDEHPDSTGPVLVHVRETATMLSLNNGYRFLGRLCDSIQQRREKGQTIAVVLTIPAQNIFECSCQQCRDGNYFNRKLIYHNTCATMLSNHFVSPIDVGQIDGKHTDYMASVNIRRLKRILRQNMSHVFDPTILHPHADWKQLVCKKPGQCFGDEQWTWDKIHGVFLQLNGRSFGKEKLEASDILLVLSRLDLHKDAKPVERIDPAPPEDVVGDLDEEPVKDIKQTWQEKMTALRQECSSAVQNLVDCVVNPGKSKNKTTSFSLAPLISDSGGFKTRFRRVIHK